MTLPSGELWPQVREHLRTQMSKATFETYLLKCTAQEENGVLVIWTETTLTLDQLENRLRPKIEQAIQQVLGEPCPVEFRVKSSTEYQPDLFFIGTYRDAYNTIVQPDEIHYTTKYFHQQWLPLLGPGLWLLIWEMRTRCYRDKKTGQVVRDTFEATYEELGLSVGMSKRTVWGLLHPKEPGKKALLDKFIIRQETKRRYSKKHGGSVNEKTIWKIRLDDPLTPEDEIRLEQLLSPTRKICE